MKNKSLLSYALLISMSLSGLIATAQNTVVTGNIKGLSGDTININYFKNGVHKTDTVIAGKDIFTWKGNLNEPQQIGIAVGRNGSFYFIDPGHITLTGVKGSGKEFKVSGSQTQKDAEAFVAFTQDLIDQQNALYNGFAKLSPEEKAIIKTKANDINMQRKIRAGQFIASHPKSFYSLSLISQYGADYKEIKSLYDKLDQSIKQSESGKKLAQKLETLKKSRIGTQMADFEQNDINGKPVSFSSFKGKYVLVDFWASWCAPCRAENPNVLKVYNAFKDKGFTVVGISLDDKAANWKKAIADDKMPWTQLSDLKGWKNEVSTYFGIQAIPSNLLIDPSGKIIARDLRGEMLENKLKQLLTN